MSKRVVTVGLDGMGFNLLDFLNEHKAIPNLSEIINRSYRAKMRTVIPPITIGAWSSMVTGKNLGKIGCYEFFIRKKESNDFIPVNSNFINGHAIWDILTEQNKKSIVIDLPCTYPAYPINGIMTSGNLTPMESKNYIYPQEIRLDFEKKMGPRNIYHVKVFNLRNCDAVIDEAIQIDNYVFQAAEYFMDNYEWDFSFIYIYSTDKLQHELWHLFDPSHPYYTEKFYQKYITKFLDYFKNLDENIAKFVDKYGTRDTMFNFVSDHNLDKATSFVNMNNWLLEKGFIKLKKNVMTKIKYLALKIGLTPRLIYKLALLSGFYKVRTDTLFNQNSLSEKIQKLLFLNFDDIDKERTEAFSKGNFGQVFVNINKKERADVIISNVIAALREMEDNGEKVIGEIFRKEDIYTGEYVDQAPDITILMKDFKYKPLGVMDFPDNKVFSDIIPSKTGSHRMDGIFIAYGDDVTASGKEEHIDITDVLPVWLKYLHCSIPDDIDSNLDLNIFKDSKLDAFVTYTPGEKNNRNKKVYSASEEEEIKGRLHDLGYV